MRIKKTLLFIFIFAFFATIFCFSQKEIQSRIKEIETLLNDDISPWKIKRGEVPGGEKADWWEDHVLLKVAFQVDVKNDKATYEIPFASERV